METLVVGTDGSVTIPPDVILKSGVHPGEELTIIETAVGWTVYREGVDEETLAWWNSLMEQEPKEVRDEARRYEALSEEERGAIWN
jgi:hypothetical protein